MKPKYLLILPFILLLTSFKSFSYYSVLDTGNPIIKKGTYSVMPEVQLFTSNYTGINVNMYFDSPIDSSQSVRAMLGVGSTQFQASLDYKWIPIAETTRQPAIGAIATAGFSILETGNDLSLRVSPLVSRQFQTKYGRLTGYASLPLGISSVGGTSRFPIQLTVGSEFKEFEYKNSVFFGEIGINISNRSNVEIENANVINFTTGIYVDPSYNISVTLSSISDTTTAISLLETNTSTISNNTLYYNNLAISWKDSYLNKITHNFIIKKNQE